MWSMLPAGWAEQPSGLGETRLASPATTDHSPASASTRSSCARSPSMWKFTTWMPSSWTAWAIRRSFVCPTTVAPRSRAGRVVRIASPSPVTADRRSPWFRAVKARAPTGSSGRRATAVVACIPLHSRRWRSAQTGTSWRHTTSGRSRVTSSIIWRRNARRSGGEALPWKRFHVRPSTATRVAYEPVRVLLADPPAFTPPYDHELAAALARDGVDVELVTSRFRFGAAPEPDGYRRRELFYPLSSRLFGRSPLRLPLKVAEHPFGLAALRGVQADVLHVQWLPAP